MVIQWAKARITSPAQTSWAIFTSLRRCSLTNPSKKNAARGVHIKLEEEKVVVAMSVLMAYGHTIPEMGKAVQEAVKTAIESMTGLEVAAVNVSVSGIVFPQPEQ